MDVAHTTAVKNVTVRGEKIVAKDKNNEPNLNLMIGYFLSHLII